MNHRRLTFAIASIAALATAPVALSASGSASAAQPAAMHRAVSHHAAAGGQFQIYSEMNTSMCLTIAWPVHGAVVDMEGCDPARSDQRWYFGPNSQVRNSAAANLCLDDRYNNPAGGAGIDVWDCNPWAAQSWTYNSSEHELTNANRNCLDITDANRFVGAGVKLFPCKGVSNQHWYFQ